MGTKKNDAVGGQEIKESPDTEFQVEEVSFRNGGITLYGDLLKPQGPGPFPVFVWCHGSGKSVRKWGMKFSECFLKSGYAFLTWDKPGAGKSGGRFYQQSLSGRAREVLAAVKMLRTRKDIDGQRVAFCGVSQAGYVLPRVAQAFPKAEALVLIGPGSMTFGEERIYQRGTLALEKNLPFVGITKQSEIAEASAFWRKIDQAPDDAFADVYLDAHIDVKGRPWYPKFQAISSPPETPSEIREFKRAAREGFAFDAIEQYSAIRCPTLILFGEKDECVNPKVGVRRIRAGFRKSGNTKLSVIIYPGANHGLGGAGEKPKDDIMSWLSRLPRPRGKSRKAASPR